jgi:hypothetical protein
MDSKGLRLIKEAYGGIYINQEEEIISESDCGCEHEKGEKDKKKEEIVAEEQLDEMVPALQEPVKKALDAGAKFMNTNPVGKTIKKVLAPAGPGRGTVTKADQDKKIQQNNSADLFDIVKGHLMSEGYADTEEAALAIMANMSEEWRQSIVEMGLTPDQEQRRRDLSKAINKAGTPGNPGVNDPATRKMQGEYIQLQKLKGV